MDRARIECWTPLPFSQLGEGDAVKWVWFGYLAGEHVTLLSALWKSGKSTLAACLMRECEAGGNLAGVVETARVLVISEESVGLWLRRRDDLSLGDLATLSAAPFLPVRAVRSGRTSWPM